MKDVYYCLYITEDDKITVICLQEFDESGYNHRKFLRKNNEENYKFDSEEAAVNFLNENIKPEYIDPDYILIINKQKKYFK